MNSIQSTLNFDRNNEYSTEWWKKKKMQPHVMKRKRNNVDKNKIMGKLFDKRRRTNWQLFRATNYISLMYPCFLLSKLYGLFPYRFVSNKFVSSRIGYTITTILIALYMLLLGFILYHMDISNELEYDSVPGTLQCHCYFLLGWVLIIVNYIRCNTRMNLLGTFVKRTSQIPSVFYSSLSRIVHVKDLFGFFFLMGQVPNIFTGKLLLAASKLLGMYTTIIVYLMDTLYVDCVLVIGILFKDVNSKLKKLKRHIDRDQPHMLRRIYHVKCNPIILTDLQLIMKEHNDISELVTQLNETFDLQLIASTTLTFTEITFSLYFYILKLSGAKEINLEKQIWYSYFITSVSYYAIKLTQIVWACEHSASQASRTGIIIHQMLNDTTDREIAEELQLFSLQLLHRDNSFKAKGLSIDALLLTSIVGGITTYLLILIQFLASSDSCDSISNSTASPTECVTPN